MECVTAICETFKTSCLMGIHFMRGGSVNHSKDQSFRLVRWSNITRFLPKTSQDSTKFGNQVLPRKFLGYAVYAEGIWKGDTITVADLEELENLGAPEIHARRLIAKEVIPPKCGDNFIFPAADGTVKLFW